MTNPEINSKFIRRVCEEGQKKVQRKIDMKEGV
jgi:hypothetical protein